MPDTTLKITSEGTVALSAATATSIAGGDGSQGIVTVRNDTGATLYLRHCVTDGAESSVSSSTGAYTMTLASGSFADYAFAENGEIVAYSIAGGDIEKTVVVQRFQ